MIFPMIISAVPLITDSTLFFFQVLGPVRITLRSENRHVVNNNTFYKLKYMNYSFSVKKNILKNEGLF